MNNQCRFISMQTLSTQIKLYTEIIVDTRKGTVSLPSTQVAGLGLNGIWQLSYQKKERTTRSEVKDDELERYPREGRALTRTDFIFFAKQHCGDTY